VRRLWRYLAACLVVTGLLLGGMACGRGDEHISPSPTANKVGTVAIVTPEKANDYGWNEQGVEGVRAAAKAAGAEVIVQDGAGYGDITSILNQLAASKPQLIFAWASGYNTVAAEVAQQRGIPVVIVGAGGDTANVPGCVVDFETEAHKGSYLAGVLAARMTRTGTVAIVVSAEDENWTKMSGGFIAGARATLPDIHILYAQIGQAGYADAAGGKRVTQSAIAGGADVVFGMGDGSSFGMMQACETSRPPAGAEKVWFIDVIGDKSSLDERGIYLSSVVWDLSSLATLAIKQVEQGAFGSETYWLNTENGIGLLRTQWIPGDVWAAVEEAAAGIAAGDIDVPLTATGAEVKDFLNRDE